MYNKEFGSNFCELIEECNLYLDDSEYVKYFDSGRSAIRYLLDKLNTQVYTVLLPQYICESEIEPFIQNGYKIFFYPVNKKFEIVKKEFEKMIEYAKPHLVVVQSYFGADSLNNIRNYLGKLQRTGILIVEDITHSVFASYKREGADYLVGSLRKWHAIPDGGVLAAISSKAQKLKLIEKLNENDEYLKLRLEAQAQKRRYLDVENEVLEMKEKFIELFEKSESILNQQRFYYSMSNYTRKRMLGIDWDKIKKRRRDNYLELKKKLGYISEIEVVDVILDEDVIPLYCPIYVRGDYRDDLRKKLRSKGIFLPIIWPEPRVVKECVDIEVSWIYEHILAIPCDQRYDSEDMRNIVEQIRGIMNEIVQ